VRRLPLWASLALICFACSSNPSNSTPDPLDGIHAAFERDVRVPNLTKSPVWVGEVIHYEFHDGEYRFWIETISERQDLILPSAQRRYWAQGLYKVVESKNGDYRVKWQRVGGQEFNYTERVYADLAAAVWMDVVVLSLDGRYLQIGGTLYTIGD